MSASKTITDLLIPELEAQSAAESLENLAEKLRKGIVIWDDIDFKKVDQLLRTKRSINDGNSQRRPIIKTEECQDVMDSLCQLSMVDALTGLFNRRYFNMRFTQEINRARREQIACSLVIADIDHFKGINDKHGHQFGDDVLKTLGDIMRSTFRTTDVIARYGGEEFVAVLPNTFGRQAVVAAERFIKGMESHRFSAKNMNEPVTVSAGATTFYPNSQIETNELIRTADEALYQAKNKGRNRVVLLGELEPKETVDGVSTDEKAALTR